MAVAVKEVFRPAAGNANHRYGGVVAGRRSPLTGIDRDVDVQRLRPCFIRLQPPSFKGMRVACHRILQMLRRDL